MADGQLIRIADESAIGQARRQAAGMSARLGLDEQAAGRLAIVVNELGRNLWQHAHGGELVLRPLDGAPVGVEVLALDKGPGIADVGRALGDGFSTAGTAGTGLGAARRQSQQLEIWSDAAHGTAVVARLYAGATAVLPPRWGVVAVPKPGEEVCGDAWAVDARGPLTRVVVADGLGHGPDAATAARAAVQALRASRATRPVELLAELHQAVRGTRGAAVAVATLDSDAHELRFAGLGNVAATLVVDEQATGLLSTYGTLGSEWRKPAEHVLALAPHAMLILATDGVRARWQLSAYPGLGRRDPSLVAGVLYRDFAPGRDDATVVVVRP